MFVSIIIPCYNSQNTIGTVVKDLKEVMNTTEYTYEIVLVNDGSKDQVWEVIKGLCNSDKVIGVNLSKNFGQTPAKLAGLHVAHGEVVVFMDDDGQHVPEDVPKLVKKIEEGFDIVFGYFPHKKHSLFKRVTSKLYRIVEEKMGAYPKNIEITSFCAWSKFCIDNIKTYSSPFPSIDGFLFTITDKITNVETSHRDRIEGKSNYNLHKLFSVWLNTFTNFSIKPLRIATAIGLLCSAIGFLYGVYLIIQKFIFEDVILGYTSIASIVLFIGGLIMVMLGLIGEYIGRIYMTLSQKQQFNIREILKYGGEK